MVAEPDLRHLAHKVLLVNLLKQSCFQSFRQMDTFPVSSPNIFEFKHLKLSYGNVILLHASAFQLCPVPVLLLAWFR